MGRPLGFDPKVAIRAALAVFWAKGFEGATLSELTEAMQISRPSLYATFGDKETLFHKAMKCYDLGYMGFFDDALADPCVGEAIRRIVDGFLDLNTSETHPHGSPDTVGALVCSDAADSVRRWLLERRQKREAALAARFAKAVEEGQWPPGTDTHGLAAYLMTLLHGMDVQAASGASRKRLQQIVGLGLAVIPKATA